MKLKIVVFLALLFSYTPLLVAPIFATSPYPTKKMEQKLIRKAVIEKVKEKVKAIGMNAKVTGEIMGISGNTLTVKHGSKSYTVSISSSVKLYRRFGAKAIISEFAVGDKVNVVGTWTDDGQTQINATYIRDVSIQKRNANFRGTVVSKGTDSFVLDPRTNAKKRGENKTVTLASNVVIKGLGNKALTFADIQVGDKVVVLGGIWNRQENQLFDVTKVIDSSQPKK